MPAGKGAQLAGGERPCKRPAARRNG